MENRRVYQRPSINISLSITRTPTYPPVLKGLQPLCDYIKTHMRHCCERRVDLERLSTFLHFNAIDSTHD